ncbi:ParB family transcriptional regulator, chromosome partitioning protein [Acidiphilium sp. MT5]
MTKPQPKRLGRGLAALMGDQANAGPLATPQSLATADLEPGPFQPRRTMDEAALDELAESLKAQGVLQPLLVRAHPTIDGRYQIIAGERRWRAAQRAGLHEVPVLIRRLSDTEAMAAGLVENLQRQDLDPIEEAEGFRRLMTEFGLSQEALAQAVGKSRSHVANLLRLLNLPMAVQRQVREGAMSSGHARAIIGHPRPEEAARAIIERKLSVRQAEKLTQEALTAKAPPPRPPAQHDPETRALEKDLSERLGLSVRINYDGKRGTVSVVYNTLDQLEGIVALLNGAQ